MLFDAPNLADSDPLLRWIPTTLPEYCYLFMTFTPCKAYELKKTNVSDDAIVEMPDLVVEAREELAGMYNVLECSSCSRTHHDEYVSLIDG